MSEFLFPGGLGAVPSQSLDVFTSPEALQPPCWDIYGGFTLERDQLSTPFPSLEDGRGAENSTLPVLAWSFAAQLHAGAPQEPTQSLLIRTKDTLSPRKFEGIQKFCVRNQRQRLIHMSVSYSILDTKGNLGFEWPQKTNTISVPDSHLHLKLPQVLTLGTLSLPPTQTEQLQGWVVNRALPEFAGREAVCLSAGGWGVCSAAHLTTRGLVTAKLLLNLTQIIGVCKILSNILEKLKIISFQGASYSWLMRHSFYVALH